MNNHESMGSMRPPIFDGSNFVYWKIRTTTYLQSLGADVWEIVEGGYTFPTTIPADAADDFVNCMKNLGEEIKEVTLVEKILRSLSAKFESKVSSIEKKHDLQNITMTQLHGISSSFEMRKGGSSDMREVVLKASAKGKEEHNESGHISKEEDEVN
eukprot:PITA_14784